jgi:ABC-type lipoprotein release transport system permease subunit
MGLIFRLSLRNLFRQKRRNLLLGIGIGFGMMILVIANSFSHGMVDVLINDVVSNAFGHLVIQSRPGNSMYSMIRDRERTEKIIRDNIKKEDIIRIDESLGNFGRAIGNGETDNVVIVGMFVTNTKDKTEFFKGFFSLVDGSYDEYFSQEIEYPVIISQQKAKSLNVKVHDQIRVRLPMVTGQVQAAKLTVVAIANANNSFMDICLFMDGARVKKLLGYKPWESASLQIALKDPKKTAKHYADLLYKKLGPEIISITGNINHEGCQLLAFNNDDRSKETLKTQIQIIRGDQKTALGKDGVLVSDAIARRFKLNVGSEFTYQYQTKYRGLHEETYKVSAIYTSAAKLGGNVIIMNGEKIYSTYDKFLPAENNWKYIGKEDPLYSHLATEWKLLERSKDSDSLMKKFKREQRVKTDQTKVDVITMYEGASQILKLEGVLNMVTVIAVLILFFIILIGVINTLRMTIRERTREIGTIRSIGMQKPDVRNMFIMETLLLTAISCVAGVILAIIVMQILGSIRFDVTNALSMILKEKHLFFKLNPSAIFSNFILIMLISGVTAYFPARRAANLSAVEALRHYE